MKYSVNKNYFQKIDSSDKAYWLGFLFADGCVEYIKTGERIYGKRLNIELARKDRDHLEKFLKSIDSNHPIIDFSRETYGKLREYSKIRVSCTKMVQDLENLGCVKSKTFHLKYPKIEEKFNLDFIRGYFDGDGSWTKRQDGYYQFSIWSGSEDFLTLIRNVIAEKASLNKDKKLVKSASSNCFSLQFCGTQCKRIFEEIYRDSNLFLERKRKVCEF